MLFLAKANRGEAKSLTSEIVDEQNRGKVKSQMIKIIIIADDRNRGEANRGEPKSR